MKRQLTPTALRSYQAAPPAVRNAFEKQARLLVEKLQHPSLQAKKFDEPRHIWQARVNRQWRFYFSIAGDTYIIRDIIPHPK